MHRLVRDDHRHLTLDQIGGKRGGAVAMTFGVAGFDRDILTFDEAGLLTPGAGRRADARNSAADVTRRNPTVGFAICWPCAIRDRAAIVSAPPNNPAVNCRRLMCIPKRPPDPLVN